MGGKAIALIAVALLGISTGQECSSFGEDITATESVNVLTSPGFSENQRPEGIRCFWKVNAPEDKFVEFQFTEISLKKHHTCISEYIQIEYDDSVEPYLRYCGSLIPQKVVIPAISQPRILLVTDNSQDRNLKGFRLEYKLVDHEQRCESEHFSCKQPFKCISSEKQCDGKADCEDGKDEEGCNHKVIQPSECGIPKISPDFDRIVGGVEAVAGSWPWIGSLQANYIFPSGHGCGATLLNNLYAVTAAHCVVGRFYRAFRVKFGDHYQNTPDPGEITRTLEMFYLHPNYSRFDSTDDLAIIKLSAPVEYTDSISPICLPKQDESLKEGTLLYAAGWGDTQTEAGNSDELRQVEIPLINIDKCKTMVSRKLPERTLCSLTEDGGRNPCFGDSGGPLMKRTDNRWVIQGVVSWGPTKCGIVSEPAVYTQLSAHSDWIRSVIQKD